MVNFRSSWSWSVSRFSTASDLQTGQRVIIIVTHVLSLLTFIRMSFFSGACRFCLRNSEFYYATGHGELSHAMVINCRSSGVHASVRLWNSNFLTRIFNCCRSICACVNIGNVLAIIVHCSMYKVPSQSFFVSCLCSVLTTLVLLIPMRFCLTVFLLVYYRDLFYYFNFAT